MVRPVAIDDYVLDYLLKPVRVDDYVFYKSNVYQVTSVPPNRKRHTLIGIRLMAKEAVHKNRKGFSGAMVKVAGEEVTMWLMKR